MSAILSVELPAAGPTAAPARLTARPSPVAAAGRSSSRSGSVRAQVALTRRQALAGSLVAFVASGRPAMATAGGPLYEAWVKGDPKNKVLGDCEYGQLCLRAPVLISAACVLVLSSRITSCRPFLPQSAADIGGEGAAVQQGVCGLCCKA